MARILVIDDEEQIRTLLKKALEELGHEVAKASDGDAGLHLFRENQSDLVITDLMMPKKNGLETIRDLRAEFPEARIIAMTGFDPARLSMALELGALRAIEKPFHIKELLDAVTDALNSNS